MVGETGRHPIVAIAETSQYSCHEVYRFPVSSFKGNCRLEGGDILPSHGHIVGVKVKPCQKVTKQLPKSVMRDTNENSWILLCFGCWKRRNFPLSRGDMDASKSSYSEGTSHCGLRTLPPAQASAKLLMVSLSGISAISLEQVRQKASMDSTPYRCVKPSRIVEKSPASLFDRLF